MKLQQSLIGTCLLATLVSACDAREEQTNESTEDLAPAQMMSKPQTKTERRELREQLAEQQAKKLEDLGGAPGSDTQPVDGEVPADLIDQIVDDLAAKIDASRADIEVLHAESLIWNDGSLGCGKPGQDYTQAVVPGYRVILVHSGQQFDYRATEKGYFMLCERPALAAPGVGNEPPVQ